MSQYASGHGQWPSDPSGFYLHPTNPSQTQQLPMPYHNAPTDPTASASYLTSQNSFGYNSTQIPGLGFGGPSVSASNGATPQPNHHSWIPPPPTDAKSGQHQVTHSHATLESAKSSSQTAPLPKPPVQIALGSMEEGELSDADFDDLYDPQPEDVAAPTSIVNQKPQAGEPVRPKSYSPHLSPAEFSRSEMPSAALGGSRAGSQSTRPSLPGLGLHKNPDSTEKVPTQPSAAIPQFRSVDEAKKEAQKAILRLLPLGVKYQTYLDEGFDEVTVKSLFNELNLLPPSVPVKPATQPAKTAKPMPDQATVSEGSTPAAKDKTEERKDRIARLLAAKSANKKAPAPAASPKPAATSPAPPSDVGTLTTPILPTGPSIPSAPAAMQNVPPPSAPTAPLALRKEKDSVAKAKLKADKEALLKKKLEALKSRQAQKQLVATTVTQSNTQSMPPTVDSRPSIPLPSSVPSLAIAPVNSNVSAPEVPGGNQSQQTNPSPFGFHGQAGSSIPGLSLSTGNLGLNQSRKRPIAADFVDYSATVGTPKRPFGQDRQDSFVIDISEDSDDDVEMEVDSPGGHSASSSRVGTPNRGPVVRDFPPLSDGTPRKSLTRNNSNVPPAKLSRLDSDILRMRAKIAAAEAKKRMAGSGSQTPDVSTPELKEPSALSVDTTEHARAAAPGQRAVSSSDVESTDLPSAQLISEAASASVPQLPQQALQAMRSKHGYGQLGATTAPSPMRPATQTAAAEGDRRTRISSVHLPKLEAKLLEKQTKLKLLEQKAAQLRREIEMEAVEREKLAEELRQLEVEHTDTDMLSEAAVPQQPVEEQPATQLPNPPDEALISAKSPLAQAPQASLSGSLADGQDPEPQKSPDEITIEPNTTVCISNNITADGQNPPAPTIDSPLATKSPEPASSTSKESPPMDVVMASTTSTPESGQIDESVPQSPMNTNSGSTSDESQHQIDITPALATETISRERAEGSPEMPMISDVVHANNDTERMVDVNGEAPPNPTEEEVPSFTPYESPLTYFRAYRFHPKYSETVTGGLKSLTYTNKINPKQALCLNELTQKKCNDPECGFQHFKSMVPRDDQILMELGQADDFADGEEKSRFITGLRDLLAGCRAQKVRDMNEIGRAIIEYRRSFIGDQSRVLTSLQDTKI